MSILKGSSILITGGTGSFGKAFIAYALKREFARGYVLGAFPTGTLLLLDSSRIDVLPLAGRSFHYKSLATTGEPTALLDVITEYYTATHHAPVREIAGLRLDPFRREVYRDGRYVALTRKQFAVLEVLVAAEGGVVSAEELLERAWDFNADPFTNAVRITVSALRKRLGEPWIIATVAGVGYRIDPTSTTGREGRDRG
mgnify:CR=1 FL=1